MMSDAPPPWMRNQKPLPPVSSPVSKLPLRPWIKKHDTLESTADAGTAVDDKPPLPEGNSERVPVEWLLPSVLVVLAVVAVRAIARPKAIANSRFEEPFPDAATIDLHAYTLMWRSVASGIVDGAQARSARRVPRVTIR